MRVKWNRQLDGSLTRRPSEEGGPPQQPPPPKEKPKGSSSPKFFRLFRRKKRVASEGPTPPDAHPPLYEDDCASVSSVASQPTAEVCQRDRTLSIFSSFRIIGGGKKKSKRHSTPPCEPLLDQGRYSSPDLRKEKDLTASAAPSVGDFASLGELRGPEPHQSLAELRSKDPGSLDAGHQDFNSLAELRSKDPGSLDVVNVQDFKSLSELRPGQLLRPRGAKLAKSVSFSDCQENERSDVSGLPIGSEDVRAKSKVKGRDHHVGCLKKSSKYDICDPYMVVSQEQKTMQNGSTFVNTEYQATVLSSSNSKNPQSLLPNGHAYIPQGNGLSNGGVNRNSPKVAYMMCDAPAYPQLFPRSSEKPCSNAKVSAADTHVDANPFPGTREDSISNGVSKAIRLDSEPVPFDTSNPTGYKHGCCFEDGSKPPADSLGQDATFWEGEASNAVKSAVTRVLEDAMLSACDVNYTSHAVSRSNSDCSKTSGYKECLEGTEGSYRGESNPSAQPLSNPSDMKSAVTTVLEDTMLSAFDVNHSPRSIVRGTKNITSGCASLTTQSAARKDIDLVERGGQPSISDSPASKGNVRSLITKLSPGDVVCESERDTTDPHCGRDMHIHHSVEDGDSYDIVPRVDDPIIVTTCFEKDNDAAAESDNDSSRTVGILGSPLPRSDDNASDRLPLVDESVAHCSFQDHPTVLETNYGGDDLNCSSPSQLQVDRIELIEECIAVLNSDQPPSVQFDTLRKAVDKDYSPYKPDCADVNLPDANQFQSFEGREAVDRYEGDCSPFQPDSDDIERSEVILPSRELTLAGEESRAIWNAQLVQNDDSMLMNERGGMRGTVTVRDPCSGRRSSGPAEDGRDAGMLLSCDKNRFVDASSVNIQPQKCSEHGFWPVKKTADSTTCCVMGVSDDFESSSKPGGCPLSEDSGRDALDSNSRSSLNHKVNCNGDNHPELRNSALSLANSTDKNSICGDSLDSNTSVFIKTNANSDGNNHSVPQNSVDFTVDLTDMHANGGDTSKCALPVEPMDNSHIHNVIPSTSSSEGYSSLGATCGHQDSSVVTKGSEDCNEGRYGRTESVTRSDSMMSARSVSFHTQDSMDESESSIPTRRESNSAFSQNPADSGICVQPPSPDGEEDPPENRGDDPVREMGTPDGDRPDSGICTESPFPLHLDIVETRDIDDYPILKEDPSIEKFSDSRPRNCFLDFSSSHKRLLITDDSPGCERYPEISFEKHSDSGISAESCSVYDLACTPVSDDCPVMMMNNDFLEGSSDRNSDTETVESVEFSNSECSSPLRQNLSENAPDDNDEDYLEVSSMKHSDTNDEVFSESISENFHSTTGKIVDDASLQHSENGFQDLPATSHDCLDSNATKPESNSVVSVAGHAGSVATVSSETIDDLHSSDKKSECVTILNSEGPTPVKESYIEVVNVDSYRPVTNGYSDENIVESLLLTGEVTEELVNSTHCTSGRSDEELVSHISSSGIGKSEESKNEAPKTTCDTLPDVVMRDDVKREDSVLNVEDDMPYQGVRCKIEVFENISPNVSLVTSTPDVAVTSKPPQMRRKSADKGKGSMIPGLKKKQSSTVVLKEKQPQKKISISPPKEKEPTPVKTKITRKTKRINVENTRSETKSLTHQVPKDQLLNAETGGQEANVIYSSEQTLKIRTSDSVVGNNESEEGHSEISILVESKTESVVQGPENFIESSPQGVATLCESKIHDQNTTDSSEHFDQKCESVSGISEKDFQSEYTHDFHSKNLLHSSFHIEQPIALQNHECFADDSVELSHSEDIEISSILSKQQISPQNYECSFEDSTELPHTEDIGHSATQNEPLISHQNCNCSVEDSTECPLDSVCPDSSGLPCHSSLDGVSDRFRSEETLLSIPSVSESNDIGDSVPSRCASLPLVSGQVRRKSRSRIPTKQGGGRGGVVIGRNAPVRPAQWLSKAELGQEIQRLSTLCEARTKELNRLKMETKHVSVGFDAFAALFKYMVEDLNGLSVPMLSADLQKTLKQLELAKQDLAYYEREVEEMKSHHCQELNDLSNKLFEVFQGEVTELSTKHEEEMNQLKHDHQTQIEALTSSLNASSEEARAQQEALVAELQQELINQREELQLFHERELHDLEVKHSQSSKTLQEHIEQMQKKCEDLKQHSLGMEDAMRKDTNSKLQWVTSRKLDLEKEVESLKAVLEMKNKELHTIRVQNLEMEKQLEELPLAREKIKMLQARAEDLEALMAEKTKMERKLLSENQQITETYEKESKVNRRLSMENEELQWRLRQAEQSIVTGSFSEVPEDPEEESNFPTSPAKSPSKSPGPNPMSRSVFFTYVDKDDLAASSSPSAYKKITPGFSANYKTNSPARSSSRNKSHSEPPQPPVLSSSTPRKGGKKSTPKRTRAGTTESSYSEQQLRESFSMSVAGSMASSLSSECSVYSEQKEQRLLEEHSEQILHSLEILREQRNAEECSSERVDSVSSEEVSPEKLNSIKEHLSLELRSNGAEKSGDFDSPEEHKEQILISLEMFQEQRKSTSSSPLSAQELRVIKEQNEQFLRSLEILQAKYNDEERLFLEQHKEQIRHSLDFLQKCSEEDPMSRSSEFSDPKTYYHMTFPGADLSSLAGTPHQHSKEEKDNGATPEEELKTSEQNAWRTV